MRTCHQPRATKRNNRNWVINCPECTREADHHDVPIGIDMPLESQLTAERLIKNHTTRGPTRRSRAEPDRLTSSTMGDLPKPGYPTHASQTETNV